MLERMSIVVHRVFRLSIIMCAAALWIAPSSAFAQGGDVTFFIGAAYPLDRERFTLRPSTPSIPGADVTVTGDPALRAGGGLVVGGAAAFEFGVLGIEGRLDTMTLDFDLTGARYDLRGNAAPFQGLTAAVTIGDGDLESNRIKILSVNARLRTPGPISLVASGGFSYLPDVNFEGTVPISVQAFGVPVAGDRLPLRLAVSRSDSNHRYGINGGAGLRVGGAHVAVIGEVRAFYFQDYELTFAADNAPGLVSDLLQQIPTITFDPIVVNAQAGLVLRF
jgi:hypothetical protein